MAEESKSYDVSTSDMVPDIDFKKILEQKKPSGYRRLQNVAKSLLLPAKGKDTIVKELQKVLDFRLRVYGPRNEDERLVRNGIAKIINEGGLNDEFIQDLDRIGVSGGGARLQRTKDFYASLSMDRTPANIKYLEKQVLGYARQQYLLMLLEDSITRDEAGNPVHDRAEYYKRKYKENFGNDAPATYPEAIEELIEQIERADSNYQDYEECQNNFDEVEDQLRRATQRSNYNEQLAAEANQRLLDHHVQNRATRAAIMEGRGLPPEVERGISDMADQVDIPTASSADGDDFFPVSRARQIAGAAGVAAAAVAARQLRKSRKRCKYVPKPNSPPNANDGDYNTQIRNDVIELFKETPKMFKDVETVVKQTREGDVYTYVLQLLSPSDQLYNTVSFMLTLRNDMPLPTPLNNAFNNLSVYRRQLELIIFPAFLEEEEPDDPIFQNRYGLDDILNEIMSIVKSCNGGKPFTNAQQTIITKMSELFSTRLSDPTNYRIMLDDYERVARETIFAPPRQSFNYEMGKRRTKSRRRSRSKRRHRSKSRRRSRSRRKRRSKSRRRSRSSRRKRRSKSRRRRSARRCWPGYKRVPGKSPYSKGSCVKR